MSAYNRKTRYRFIFIMGVIAAGIFLFVYRNALFSSDSQDVKNEEITLVSESIKPGDDDPENKTKQNNMSDKIEKTEDEWKEELSDEEYHVLRQKGTERAFTGEYYLNKEKGLYVCGACGNELFSSNTKYESGSGWPSYYEPISESSIKLIEDSSHGMVRTEVACGKCESHLGHVFDDGPQPTGLRYCINSVSLDFNKGEGSEKENKEEGEQKEK